MRARILTLGVLVLMPSLGWAAPITLGTWSAVSPGMSNGNQQPFWDGVSWDGANRGIGDLLSPYAGLEFLHNGAGQSVAFLFDNPVVSPTLMYNITAWQGGSLAQAANGAFTYNSGTGRLSNSLENSVQYALFRVVGTGATQYFLGVEDILIGYEATDRDHNDYVVTFTQSVPEPSALALLLLASGAAAAGRRLRRWTARGRVLPAS
jgi:hypothetical protein